MINVFLDVAPGAAQCRAALKFKERYLKMSDVLEACANCGEVFKGPNTRENHVCPPAWFIHSESFHEEGVDCLVYAATMPAAAEKWAQHFDENDGEGIIAIEEGAEVLVRPSEGGVWKRYKVNVVPKYVAELIEGE